MFFQNKLVEGFLIVVIHLQLCESLNIQFINVTLFAFNHPSSCRRNEFYNLDYFSCTPCDSKYNLKPSLDKFGCECTSDSRAVAIYDSYLHRPICVKSCNTSKTHKCPNITTSMLPKVCRLKYANYTSEDSGAVKHIRVYSYLPNSHSDCICDLKYNYQYADYCILKGLLNNYLNYNAFRQRDIVYADLKFIAFCCQSLENTTACNHLANLCVQSFFDTDKNSACSMFLLSQASDATLYPSNGVELLDSKPFLFYKRGKDTVQEMEERVNYPFSLNADKESDVLQLFRTEYSLDGQLTRWGQFRPSHVNLCGQGLHDNNINFRYFRNVRISCDLSMETIIDLASLYTNKQFFNVFLNYTKDDHSSYMKSVPILIVDAFKQNSEPNVADWQLVKRFQIVGSHKAIIPTFPEMSIYDDSYKLRLFKSIRILKKFELRCSVTEDNKISIPLIVLNYHQINITLNTSLNEIFKFELVVTFKNEHSSMVVYKICLPTFLTVGLVFAVFRIYILKNRQNVECCDTKIVLQFFLYLISNVGNSFFVTAIIDVFYSMLKYVTQPKTLLMLPEGNDNILKYLIYSAFVLKGLCFIINYWKLSHLDIFFVDWERPKGYDASLHLKNNLETSSQCSSIRAYTENNVSAWRIFFTANQWIELSSKQKTSPFMQGFAALIIYEVMTGVYSMYYLESITQLFTCIVIFSSVYIVQIMIRKLLIDQMFGCPLQKFMDICAMANVSIITLIESSYGFYLHGRSPHGFSDTDMSSMILQLQRESQNMCGKRGLLSDSDVQTYVMLPPLNLKTQIEKLLPLHKNSDNLSQVHFQKELRSMGTHIEGTLDNTPTSYNRVNRFFCAFIDHAIKDLDYIIKEKSFMENLLGCEFESFLTENKGTFYIDSGLTFGSLFLYGNQNHIFAMEMLILLATNLLTNNFVTSIIIVSIWNKLFQKCFRNWVRNNVATKTLIDQRFLMNI